MVKKRKKQDRNRNRNRSLCRGYELFEPRILLSGWFTNLYNSYNNYIAPVVQKTVDIGSSMAKTVERAVTTTYKEVEQYFVEPVVRTVKKVDKVVERATDVAIDHVSREIDKGIKATTNLFNDGKSVANNVVVVTTNIVKKVEDTASKVEKKIDSTIPSIPGTVGIAEVIDIGAGVYDGAKGLVTGVASLAKDGYFVTVGQVTNPVEAKETADKWKSAVNKVMEDPHVIFTSLAESYVKEGNVGRVVGRIGFDVATAFVGVGEANAALRGAKTLKGVEAVSKVVKVTKVADTAKVVSAAPKLTGKWNKKLFEMDLDKLGAKGYKLQDRLDMSGLTGHKKDLNPHVNSEVIKVGRRKPVVRDAAKNFVDGFNGMQYGGRLASSISSVPVKMSKRK